jgi:murein DD-endopeptidase MepM/ murein hydrolase activator NlpD
MPRRRTLVLAVGVIGLAGCTPEPPRPSLTEAPTHERYTAALSEFGLDKTALGQDWLRAARVALESPIATTLPFREEGYLPPASPSAVAYRFELRRGRRLVVDVTFDAAAASRVYVDLFEEREGQPPSRVGGAEPGQLSFAFEARRDGVYILRLQPELLRGGRYTIVERTTASLGFPVQGLSLAAMQSVFGDPRDGGRRDHHGIDIFAPRGTPVVAAVDGYIRATTNNLGGQVIWLRGNRPGRLYYAHLDSWAVQDGASVRAGDVIGYVGNTGNARSTPPHLHFGVYDRGPVDPVPFLRPDDAMPRAVADGIDVTDEWARVSRRTVDLVDAPGSRATTVTRLAAGQVVRVDAARTGFYRVRLPDGTAGFVAASSLEPLASPLDRATVAADHTLHEAPWPAAPVVDNLAANATVEVLGWSEGFGLIRRPGGGVAWARLSAAR